MFSIRCNFQVESYVYPKQSPGYLTPFESNVCSLVYTSGAVALSQVCANSKQKQKLKNLARLGVFGLHYMKGTWQGKPITHAVLTPGLFPGVMPALKRMAASRLSILLDYAPLQRLDDEHYLIYLGGEEYHAFVHREPEAVKPLIITASQYASFILMENYHYELGGLDPDTTRVLLDDEIVFAFLTAPLKTLSIAEFSEGKPNQVTNLHLQGVIVLLSDSNAYVLGLLWGLGSKNPDGYLFRHRDRWFLETIKQYLNLPESITKQSSRTGSQYRIKVSN